MSVNQYPYPKSSHPRAQDSALERPVYEVSPKPQGDEVSQMTHTNLKTSALRSSHSPVRPQAIVVQVHDARGTSTQRGTPYLVPPQNKSQSQNQVRIQQQQHPQHHQQRPKVPPLQINTSTRGSSSATERRNTSPPAAAPAPGQGGSLSAPVNSSPAQQQLFHPEVVRGAAAALLPAQSLFENAWQVTVHRVQTEFNRMHMALMNKVDAEKATHTRMYEACTRLGDEVEDARYQLGLASKEQERLTMELVKALEENQVLKTNLTNTKKELDEKCKRLGVEIEIWKEGWAIAKTVQARLEEGANEQDEHRLMDADNEKIIPPPGLMDNIQKQIDNEVQARIGKLLANIKQDSGLKIQTDNNHSILYPPTPSATLHASPGSTPTSPPSNEHTLNSETSTAVCTPASGTPNLRLETRKCGADQEACRVVSVETWSGTISPEVSIMNVEARSQLERCPTSKTSEDGKGDQESLRPLKRRRTECREEEEVNENDGCRPEKNVERVKLQTRGQSCEIELSEREDLVRRSHSDVDDSVDDMQLESDSDIVKASPIPSGSKDQTPPWTRRTPAQMRSKIGISHIDLLYDTQQLRMMCRMCLTRSRTGAMNPVTSFPLDSSWASLIGHCESEHPAALDVLVRMSPAQVVEMRQRILRGEVLPS